jgi:hypothetical protein
MLFANRGPRSLAARRRGSFRPAAQALEQRLAPAIANPLDLGAAVPPTGLPNIANDLSGIDFANRGQNNGAGFVVTDVGDLFGSGFDDYLVSAPSVTNVTAPLPGLGLGSGTSAVYLILGSVTTNASTIVNWLNNTANQRVGQLPQLGNPATGQTNPINGTPTYPFAGVTFITSRNSSSRLGASVAAAGTINGQKAFLIGAPGGLDQTGLNPGTGRAYLIYANSTLLSLASTAAGTTPPVVDLDTAGSGGVNFVTFTDTNASGFQIGRSVAGVGDILGQGGTFNNIAIGAPGANIAGAGSGAVFVLAGSALPTAGTVQLNTVGKATGIVLTGDAGSGAGFSVANAGSIDNHRVNNVASLPKLNDFLVGAPFANNSAGAAYLIFGDPNLYADGTITNNLNQLPLSTFQSPTNRGLIIGGAGLTGYSVSSAGDFNGDGVGDFIIGSPGFNNFQGRADVYLGVDFNVNNSALVGTTTIGTAPPGVFTTGYLGAPNTPDQAGASVSLSGKMLTGPTATLAGNPILIGEPGFTAGSGVSGTAFLIPQNPFPPLGNFILDNSLSNAFVRSVQVVNSNPNTPSPGSFGYSVTGALSTSDFMVGSPGYAVPTANPTADSNAGGAFVVQGPKIANLVQVPSTNIITSGIGVDAPNNGRLPPPTYTVSATTPNTVRIFVLSNKATGFDPVVTLNPATVIVNNTAFPNATIAKDPVDENGDLIEDAIITISPRSALKLTNLTSTFTLVANTLPTSLFPGQIYESTARISVTGGGSGVTPTPPSGGGTGGAGGSSLPIGAFIPTTFIAPFGPDTYVPSLATLSEYNDYKPLPEGVALQQFLPGPGFAGRIAQFAHPKQYLNQFGYNGGNGHDGHRTTTLGTKVFTRGVFKPNKPLKFTHEVNVVPVNLQSEVLRGETNPLLGKKK